MNKVKLILIFLFAVNMPAFALIRNVPSQYSTIQSAINASLNHDTILVQPGSYFENLNFRGKNIVLTSRYYQNNDYSFIHTTIINGSTPQYPDSGSCVIICSNEDSTAVLQGFSITGGTGTKWTDEHGAGLYREGGGILIQYAKPVIQHNIIHGNQTPSGGVSSTGGGGVRIGDSYPRFLNNVITNNTGRYGAGIVLNYTGGEYRNNIVYKNYGSLDYGAGSGLWINGSFSRPVLVENNTIAFNTALSGTAGVYSFGAPATLRNNIVWGNMAVSSVQISGSGLTVRYCNVQGGFSGAGNINTDPMFDSTNYYLRSSSPCIDKGDSSTVYNDPQDPGNPGLAKWPARGTLRNDMGAYGGPMSSVIANTTVGVNNGMQTLIPSELTLYQNYPNPFNPKTVIKFEIEKSNFVTLKVYDALGKEVAVLVNEYKTVTGGSGNFEVEFDVSSAGGLTSGIYFYTLKAGEFSETKRMMLLK